MLMEDKFSYYFGQFLPDHYFHYYPTLLAPQRPEEEEGELCGCPDCAMADQSGFQDAEEAEEEEEEVEELPMDLSLSSEARRWREMREFVSEVKRRRLSLGLTQGDVGAAVGALCHSDFSQTTISRFEAVNLSFRNMCKLRPLLQRWMEDTSGNSNSSNSNNSNNSSNSSSSSNAGSAGPSFLGVRRRKKRTSFDTSVRSSLERSFRSNPRPTAGQICRVAGDLGVDKEVVRVWFCNRRQKEKRGNNKS